MSNNKLDLKELLSGKGEEFIQTEFATLFIEEDEAAIPVPEDIAKKIGMSKVPVLGFDELKKQHFVLYYTDFAHEGSELHELHHALRTESNPEDDLTTRIFSPGGSVFEGMNLASLTGEKFKGSHTTVLESEAASMGAMLFLAGDRRVAYEFSSFMLHDWSAMVGGSGGNLERQIVHANRVLSSYSKRYLVDPGFISESEFATLKAGAEIYYETYEMVLRGIATHVIVSDALLSGDEFIDYYDSKLPIDEFLTTKEELEDAKIDNSDLSQDEIIEMIKSGQLEVSFGGQHE